MRKIFEMAQEDLDELLAAAKPVPLIATHCGPSPSRQEMVNAVWARLGKKMGFYYRTAQSTGQGDRFFSAVPVEESTQT